MIKQIDQINLNEVVSISTEDSSVLSVADFEFNGHQIQGQNYDLSDLQGSAFRLYVTPDNKLSKEPTKPVYWLLVEAILPEKKYVAEKGADKEMKLDLNDQEIKILVFPLPLKEGV